MITKPVIKKKKYYFQLQEIFTDPRTKIGLKGTDWVKKLNVTPATFIRRLKDYGKNDERVYFTKSEMKEDMYKRKSINKTTKSKWVNYTGNLERREITIGRKTGCKSMVSLVAGMIDDAKDNLELNKFGKRKPFYAESKSWLMNGNGGLKKLLNCIPNIDVNQSLKELYEYAKKR